MATRTFEHHLSSCSWLKMLQFKAKFETRIQGPVSLRNNSSEYTYAGEKQENREYLQNSNYFCGYEDETFKTARKDKGKSNQEILIYGIANIPKTCTR
jgi:hypothetical protein